MKSAKYHDINNQPKREVVWKIITSRYIFFSKEKKDLSWRRKPKSSNLGVVYGWGSALWAQQVNRRLKWKTTYLGIPRQPPNPANLGVVYGGGSAWWSQRGADVWTDDHIFGQTDARLMPDGPADWRFQSDGRACEDRGRLRWVLPIRGLVQIRSAQCASAFTSTSSYSSLFTTTTVHQATLIVLRQM